MWERKCPIQLNRTFNGFYPTSSLVQIIICATYPAGKPNRITVSTTFNINRITHVSKYEQTCLIKGKQNEGHESSDISYLMQKKQFAINILDSVKVDSTLECKEWIKKYSKYG